MYSFGTRKRDSPIPWRKKENSQHFVFWKLWYYENKPTKCQTADHMGSKKRQPMCTSRNIRLWVKTFSHCYQNKEGSSFVFISTKYAIRMLNLHNNHYHDDTKNHKFKKLSYVKKTHGSVYWNTKSIYFLDSRKSLMLMHTGR